MIAAEDAGPVRLDEDGFAALLTAARGVGDPSPDTMRVLAREGLVGPLTAALEPLVEVFLTVADSSTRQVHRGWLTFEDCLLLLAVRGEVKQLMPLPPGFLPSVLARVVSIGPRKVGRREAIPVAPELAANVVSEDGQTRAVALREVRARFAWHLTARWQGGGRELTVVDGERGLFIAADEEMLPVTATAIYRALTVLLPADDEVVGAGAPG